MSAFDASDDRVMLYGSSAMLRDLKKMLESRGFHKGTTVFASADYVDGLTVFDIGANKHRLFAAIHYNRCKVNVREVLPHATYDRGRWKRTRSN